MITNFAATIRCVIKPPICVVLSALEEAHAQHPKSRIKAVSYGIEAGSWGAQGGPPRKTWS